MPVTITNQTAERVLLRFNSGATRHLGPREVLEDVENVEVKDNARLLSLAERRIIALDAGGAKGGQADAAPPKKGEAPVKGGDEVVGVASEATPTATVQPSAARRGRGS